MNKNIMTLLLPVLALTSCIRDDVPTCPPLSVEVAVKDKNYFNVHKVELEEALDEDLPFRTYVPTLYYRLCPLGSDKPVAESEVFPVSGNGLTCPISFGSDLPYGTYVLTVWGGLKDHAPLDKDGNRRTAALHPDGKEGEDIYMTHDTLVYDMQHYDYTVEMERTKGKLLLWMVNLPAEAVRSEVAVFDLFSQVDYKFAYSGFAEVEAEYERQGETEWVTKTVLAPSALEEDGSVLDVNFRESAARATPLPVPYDVEIHMNRNELTAVKYVYERGDFTIYILVNDEWEKVHGLEVD